MIPLTTDVSTKAFCVTARKRTFSNITWEVPANDTTLFPQGTSKSFKLQSAFQSQAFSRYHSKLHFVEGDQSLEAGLNWPQEPLTIVSPVATHSHYAQRVSARAPSNSVGVFSTLFHALLTGGCFFSISMLQRMSILEAGYSFVSVLGPIQKA